MLKKMIIILCLVSLLFTGCRRGDIQISMVIEGQTTLHDGYNVGPELYLKKGDKAKVTGAVIWIKGTDPNELFE